jgi:hypothetical protein
MDRTFPRSGTQESPMHVELVHAGISFVYLSLWLIIANIAMRRRLPAEDGSGRL